jgi:hypothetical protein
MRKRNMRSLNATFGAIIIEGDILILLLQMLLVFPIGHFLGRGLSGGHNLRDLRRVA